MLDNEETDKEESTEVSRYLQNDSNVSMSILSTENENVCKELCRTIVNKVSRLSIPKNVKSNPDMKALLDMQQHFEAFTLESMFSIIFRSMKTLSSLDNDDFYTQDGNFDIVKLQAVIATQQHVMNLVTQFNMHIRRMPSAIQSYVRDIEMTAVGMAIEAKTVHDDEQKQIDDSVVTTSKPMAELLREANAELAQATNDRNKHIEDANVVDEQSKTIPEETIEPIDISDSELDDITNAFEQDNE